MAILDDISATLQKGKKKALLPLVQQAIDEGVDAPTILQSLLDGMDVIGEKFRNNEVFVPEVLICARAMNAATAMLKPLLSEEDAKPLGKACIGTVEGDMHDIGKNLVRLMLEAKGIEVTDLGVDVPADRFVSCVQEEGCQLVCCSALLTTTMPAIGTVVEALETAGLRQQVKVMVGGAPVDQTFCDRVRADAYTPDAASAARRAVELLEELTA